MLSQLCLLVLIGCAAVISKEQGASQAPSNDADFEQRLSAAVQAIKEAAKELESPEGAKESRDEPLARYLSSPLYRRSNQDLLRKTRDFWSIVGSIAKVVGAAALVIG
ncbi:hypothetical protein Bpfe_025264 [Biomphalaria pfeifferi]|uniref:Secreted protein n=1 Tax=Biomphalaria pfeifferi TaxID=112525 RepID=A0AAD8B293_BIOPF|nr:hypothetical protein Bpfe_025264 [Biomphalaria pfeifferi]